MPNDTSAPALTLTRHGDTAELTVKVHLLAAWVAAHHATQNTDELTTDEPTTAVPHPLAAGRPAAATTSDDPLVRWEVEMAAENLARTQADRRAQCDEVAATVIDELRVQFALHHRGMASPETTATIELGADEPQQLLEWLNRQYVALRTSAETTLDSGVGQGQSADAFLGLDSDGGMPDLDTMDEDAQARTILAMFLALSVQELCEQLY